jgi:localization factor PodJL
VGDDLTETRDALRALTPAESLLGMAQAVQQLSRNIVRLIEKCDACDARLNQFEATERALAELLLHLARQRASNHTPVAAAPASELNALAHDITEVRQTEKTIQGSLQAIDSALAHIANRLSVIEAKISREGGSAPDSQSSPAVKVLTPAAPIPTEVPIAPEQSATAATAEPESSAPTLLGHPVDTSPSRDDALELGSDAARGHKPITSADHIPACDPAGAAGGGRKLSVMPDCGGRSDLIAAARRAAQAASGVVSDEVSAIAKIASRQAGGIGKLHLLIGATAAIVLVLGLLQIARILVSSSDQSGLIMPTDTAASLETTPAAVQDPAVIGQPVVPELPAPSPTPPRPAIFFAEGGTVDTLLRNVLLPGWTTKHQPQPAGQASAGVASSAAAATAGLTSASVTSAPSAASPKPDLATPRPAQ